MKRGARLFTFIALTLLSSFFLSSVVSAQSFDSTIKKMTHAAEQYESGSIDYAQLIVYMGSLSKELASQLGADQTSHDAVLTASQLESALGEPTESTYWVWIEGEEKEKKLDSAIPAWREIIFDGEKLQIYLSAWPSILKESDNEKEVYRIHHDIIFKSKSQKVDLGSEIEKIKSLAGQYSLDPTTSNLEALAEESVNIEQAFNNNPYKNSLKCEANMDELLGSENRRDTQKVIAQEIDFASGDKFEAKLRLEMCDDCQWHWINLNMWIDSRGKFQQFEENRNFDREQYKGYSTEQFKAETEELLSEAKTSLESLDFQTATDKMQQLRVLTEAWNDKANNVWEQFKDQFTVDFEKMTQEEREECSNNYCWLEKDQERRRAEKALSISNYEERKQFYLSLFENYNKKESYSSQEQWEKRLFEQFKEFGEEICSNNIDDNNNQQIDCSESQCSGKVCASETISTVDENGQTVQTTRDLYCIQNTCQAKIETETLGPVCGNNICEADESVSCATDCAICANHEAISCEGTVIFSGADALSCPLAPVCVTEKTSCEQDSDCIDPLCGDSSCVEGSCELIQLTECREAECTDGDEKRLSCTSGEKLVSEVCMQGIWRQTGLTCSISITETQIPEEVEVEIISEDAVGNACTVKSDCGNENDVCSNGICVSIPQIIQEDIIIETPIEEQPQETEDLEQPQSEPEQEIQQEPSVEISEEQQEQSSTITGNAISFFKSLITGFQVEGGESGSSGEGSSGSTGGENSPESGSGNEGGESQGEGSQSEGQQFSPPQNEEETGEREEDRQEREREDREKEDADRRQNECSENCNRMCYDSNVRPFTDKCIREECGEDLECDIASLKISCEEKAKSELDLSSCQTDCSTKCIAGENIWEEQQQEEHKEEKLVFTVGGACRQEKERVDESIWFGGWGADLSDFHRIKEKYYSSGGGDWCEREYNSLLEQRKALENSLNDEFARWFFEDYVASSAEDYEKHISGIFDLYWKDVDLSRQLVERAGCLGKTELPEYKLINFEYKTDYGSIKFWEEIKTAKISDDFEETEIISPYMETYLFPSRDFYISQMKRAMENHQIPGPEGEKSANSPTEEQKQRLIEEEDILEKIRSFNELYGESLVIQFKDYAKNEIVFNVYAKIDETNLIYFEPMPPSENPSQDVLVEFDIEKLLDIIEYSESGRLELESPPWDRKPRTTFIESAVDGVKMYFMFKDMLGSAVTTPESAEKHAAFFTRMFFETVMGGGEEDERIREEIEDSDEIKREERDQFTGEVIAQY